MRRKDTAATGGRGGVQSEKGGKAMGRGPVQIDMFVCLEAGGHVVDTDPCPIHRCPTKRYGSDD